MRKARKEQIDELWNVLHQAHNTVGNCVKSRNFQDAALVLEDCQDAAISIGTAIDEEEGEDTHTVKYLEEYCELLYNIHESFFTEHEINAAKIVKQLENMLKQIRAAYNKEVYAMKEIVFLPYKASMWDSLESVWREVVADKSCLAKVIPIPYYDKKPDGSFGEYHYESDQYPKDVPVIDYREYDFERNHPDEIYIHCPYDEANYVTSVHPFFYAKNLKQFTEKLIYIPYFVLAEPDPKNAASIEEVAHFALTPGVFYADEVIVQSENMRLCYIAALVQMAGESTRKTWEHKIKGTGSPKFDRIAKVRNEEVELPDDWKKKIFGADGGRKKVILYNTGVSALLQESDDMIDKIADTLEFFKERREMVTLLWRPHPLIKATIRSMRPQLWDAYDRVVEKYITDDFGIYDDSADLDRAIAVADAYYGDGSSVVQLCRSVNMPVMIQKVHIRQRSWQDG